MGHIHNFESFIVAENTFNFNTNASATLLNILSRLDNPYLNPVRISNANTIVESFKLVSSVTGIIMCMILSLLASSACEFMRRLNYNFFYYMHCAMAILFIICFCLHDTQGIIRRQTNLDKNNPLNCYLKPTEWGLIRECDLPTFAGHFPSSWIFILIPLIVYVIEKIFRVVQGRKPHKILKIITHPSNVLELQIEKNIKYSTGQFVYLKYSEISKFEWHPFTITSAPDDPYLSIHIRSAGDWTSELIKKMNEFNENSNISRVIHVDGPYGSCAEDIFCYKKIILIGAGIGCTPYSCVLRHILSMLRKKETLKLNKIYFFWICPSIDTFEWFGEMLKTLENELSEVHNLKNLLEYKIYFTKGWSTCEAKEIVAHKNDMLDLLTGLKSKTNYGRPNFDLFFKELSSSIAINNDATENIGVFFCGPKELSSQIHSYSNIHSNSKVRFIYNKEKF